VTFFENYGWPNSCYDPARNEMTANPSYGIAYTLNLLRAHGLEELVLPSRGRNRHGMCRDRLAQLCRECDVYFNLSNINWIPELSNAGVACW